MGENVNFPDDRSRERQTITSGFFEREVYLSRSETATFLHNLADAIEDDTSVTISSDDWEIPFTYREPIEVEVEFTDQRECELEIEVEFTAPRSNGGLDVT